MQQLDKFQQLNQNELEDVQGGVGPLFVAGALIATPFVLGAIAGGADEYARKKGHR
ncbi:TPA: class IIb bacteriocin, lactobin A/cerein 7B family [Streptococcus pyogenes]|uniref:Class IIb bacteriocin, lactobin A/cerein 7B family n=1 Tax=Streptococcus pyogenes TaxID=1314 RepID=A0A5S4TIK9_STRPY|nr:class IIb bacteriocin, lactobin A/cerein 7B family [Streptococcus pyogenes]HER4687386.1 class IIb bacteriocin, lactobin A/cerein 7B family [Streptococcus pyogenes NGAS364]HER4777572.1 class IIb bacteriocin, lactobin A/cerein 7B family [Streptococcus pyogenes NGAS169]ESU92149.1 class IIb bacteriocin, lactobin A/cerein 7B family [Streptococcus pyogenes GA19702]QAX68619.1 class IIb bacteriocin, lactobin A/cerein 7B family [Streptococcus pyogenes]TYK84632.1 class IIb bacteriocin, lactobin A/cer